MSHRSLTYKKHWAELIAYYGARCYYCRQEIATTIDHVFPYSWDQDNAIDNLVPACVLCNCIAGNKVFESVEQKRQFILNRRKEKKHKRAICTACLLPYSYRIHSPSILLCAECYDQEYGTNEAETKEWKRWIEQLRAAGIPANAHREMKKRLSGIRRKNKDVKLETLIDEYSKVIDTDEEFAQMIM